jgi:hypothetical protein
VTDIKALIERLREHIGDAPSCPRLNCVQCEAADALEATVNELNGRDHDIVILEAELAEEKRKRDAVIVAHQLLDSGMQLAQDAEDWKAKFEAAREVAIRLFDRECGSGKPSEAERAVDAEIEATMKPLPTAPEILDDLDANKTKGDPR